MVDTSNLFVFLFSFTRICVSGLGSTVGFVERTYRNNRLWHYSHLFSNVSRIECVVICHANPECLVLSYGSETRQCMMNIWSTGYPKEAKGWAVYIPPYRICPVYDRRYAMADGDLTLAVCMQKLDKTFADIACSRFGHLLELRSEKIIQDTLNLINVPSTLWMRHYCPEYIVAGIFSEESGTWLLPDGSKVWTNNASSSENDVSDATTGDCALLNRNGTVGVDCDIKMCYICQI